MKKIFILSILSLGMISSGAQWTQNVNDIYNSNSGSVAIGINQFLGTEKLRIVGDVNVAGSQILGKTISASAIPAYQAGLSSSIHNKYTISGTATYGFNYNYATDNTLYIQGFGNTISGYQSAGSRSQLYLNNVILANPPTNHTWSAATNQIVAQTATATKLINTYIKSQFISSAVTNYYDLYIETPGNGQPTTHWAIYQEDGTAKSYIAGKVGLGTTSPTAYFHIKAGTASVNTAPLKFTSGTLLSMPEAGAIEFNGSHLYFTATNGGTRYQLDQQGGGTSYWTQSVTDLYYTAGNVGLGTSTPNANAKLDVNGNIFSNGKIVIGTTDMAKVGTYSLAVNGDAIFNKVKVKTYSTWPDYVFEDGYKLPSLKEVEKFYRQNKHLPEVPSAKEVERDGLDLGDNQAALLKKIEELTLYIIEINKKVEKLSEENTELKDKLESKYK